MRRCTTRKKLLICRLKNTACQCVPPSLSLPGEATLSVRVSYAAISHRRRLARPEGNH